MNSAGAPRWACVLHRPAGTTLSQCEGQVPGSISSTCEEMGANRTQVNPQAPTTCGVTYLISWGLLRVIIYNMGAVILPRCDDKLWAQIQTRAHLLHAWQRTNSLNLRALTVYADKQKIRPHSEREDLNPSRPAANPALPANEGAVF